MTEQHGTFPLEMDDSEDDLYSKTMVIEADAPTSELRAAPVAEPDQRLQTGSVLRDRYLLQERVKGGSMGVVYKALDRHMTDAHGEESVVAIKVLSPRLSQDPEALRALQQEAAKGRCLTHPHIVRFIDLDREDSLYFLVMEWLDGRSLAEVLDAGKTNIDATTAIDIVGQVGDALAYAHRCGVVHADVKPGNVMLLNDGSIKLIDFGIARVRQKQSPPAEENGVLKAATPAYSSMQVLTGEEPTAEDDVFSLACLAYRLIAGHRVFGPRNAAEAAQAGMEPQRPQGLADSQWKALRKGLAYSRVARQSSPMALVEGLVRAGSPSPAGQQRAAETTTRAVADEVVAARLDAGPPLGDDESLAIPHEDMIERRFESTPKRWPYWLLLLIVIGVAAALALRPDWREVAFAQGSQLYESVKAFTGSAQVTTADEETSDNPVAEESATSGSVQETTDGAVVPATEPATSEPSPEVSGAAVNAEQTAGAGNEPSDLATPVPQPAATEDPVTSDSAPVTTEVNGSEPDSSPAAIVETDGVARLVLAAPGETTPRLQLSVTEGADAVPVQLNRWFGLSEALLVRIDEVGFSGSRSPGEAGDYRLSSDGVISFDPGQRQARFSIVVPMDNEREQDRQVSLLLRDYYNAGSILGRVELRLLDDDQRSFEEAFAADTVAFTTGRVIVRERDPAVQIDVVRYNPSNKTLNIRYDVRDLSATEGNDYFVPGRRVISFGPSQRNARLLIPLVQDSLVEDDESFMIELKSLASDGDSIRRVSIIILDDD